MIGPVVLVRDLVEAGEVDLTTGPFGTQLKAREYADAGVPMINVRNVGFGDVREQELEFLPDEVATRLDRHRLKAGDIVFGRKGAVERHAFIGPMHEGWIQGSDCLRLRLASPRFSPRFVSYCLLTDWHMEWMKNHCSGGATMASLNQDILGRIPLPVIPMATQQKIAAILSAYDDLIENNQRRIQILEEMARRIYHEWFVEFRYPGNDSVPTVDPAWGTIPAGWAWKELRELAAECRSGVDPSSVAPETPYVGLEHMPERSIALTEWGVAGDAGSRKYEFKAGDLLFGKIRPYFHKVVVPPVDGICSTDAIVIRNRAPEYSGLVLSVVSSDSFVQQAVQTSQGTKMPRANWAVLEQYPVPVPPPPLLQRFDALICDVVALIHRLVFSTRALLRSRDLLLPRLISGEIDITDLDVAMPPTAA